jgi:hypothetical protein
MPGKIIDLHMLGLDIHDMFLQMAHAAHNAGLEAARNAPALVEEELLMTEPYPTHDTGKLSRSTYVMVRRPGPFGVVQAWNGAQYASALEYGTRPFFPPMAALRKWARRKRPSARLLGGRDGAEVLALAARSLIGKRGLLPRRYWAKTSHRMFAQYERKLVTHLMAIR